MNLEIFEIRDCFKLLELFRGQWPVVANVAVCVWLHRDDLLSSTQLSQAVRCCQKRAQNYWFKSPGHWKRSWRAPHLSTVRWILIQKKKKKKSKLILVKM